MANTCKGLDHSIFPQWQYFTYLAYQYGLWGGGAEMLASPKFVSAYALGEGSAGWKRSMLAGRWGIHLQLLPFVNKPGIRRQLQFLFNTSVIRRDIFSNSSSRQVLS